MVEFDKDEMGKNLSLWFQDDGNEAAITSLYSAQHYDIIPHMHVVGGVAPVKDGGHISEVVTGSSGGDGLLRKELGWEQLNLRL